MTADKSSIKVFEFEVNAEFAKEILAKKEIQCSINQIDEKHFNLLCDSKRKEEAFLELEKLNLDETSLTADSEGYLEEIDEWSSHMYNPIYWLERKKFPHFYYSKQMK